MNSGGGRQAARHTAVTLARQAWADRARHTRRLLSVREAVALAQRAADGADPPVIFSDSADNPGGGGRGNTTWLLRALHAAQVPGVVLGVFVDPDLAAELHALGENKRLNAVFNRVESEFSKRFEASAVVQKLSDGVGVGRRGILAGKRFNLGPSALLRLDGSGLRVVVGSLRRQLAEPVMLEMFGIDIGAARCVVVKSRGHFRAGFDEFFSAGAGVRSGHARPDQPGAEQLHLAPPAAPGLPAGSGRGVGRAGVGLNRLASRPADGRPYTVMPGEQTLRHSRARPGHRPVMIGQPVVFWRPGRSGAGPGQAVSRTQHVCIGQSPPTMTAPGPVGTTRATPRHAGA